MKIIFIQEKNDKFFAEKTSGQAASEREKILKDLAAAYDVYTELASNLKEGTKVGAMRAKYPAYTLITVLSSDGKAKVSIHECNNSICNFLKSIN